MGFNLAAGLGPFGDKITLLSDLGLLFRPAA
jgi:hypothetical protein